MTKKLVCFGATTILGLVTALGTSGLKPACGLAQHQQQNSIATVAGNGQWAFIGTGTDAVSQGLGVPFAVAPTAHGGFLVSTAARIQEVSANGDIVTVAGNIRQGRGYSGDGGPAVQATINYPRAIAVMPDGGFVIADHQNGRLRRVWPDGIITTVAGNGMQGNAADGSPAVAGALDAAWVATNATGQLLVADRKAARVRMIGDDGTITTLAGTGQRGFSGDRGPARAAKLNNPSSVAVMPDGGLLISDEGNQRVRKVRPDATIVTVAGTGQEGFAGDNGPAVSAQLSSAFTVAALPDNSFLIADTYNHRIRHVTTAGVIRTIVGNGHDRFGGDGPLARASLNFPTAVALGADGALLIADSQSLRVRRVTIDIGVRLTTRYGLGQLGVIAGSGQAGFSGDGWTAATAQLNRPQGVTTTSDGGALIADSGNHRIRRVWRNGLISTVAGNGNRGRAGDNLPATSAPLNYPSAAVQTPDRRIVIADSGNHRIVEVLANSTIETVAGATTEEGVPRQGFGGDGGPAKAALLSDPSGLVVRPSGEIIFSDSMNNRVREIDRGGKITTIAGSGEAGFAGDGGPATKAALAEPNGLALTLNGELLIADTLNHRIRKVTSAGKITTIAGSGSPAFPQVFSGDGGQATAATLNYPTGVAVDSRGDVFIADNDNARIRRIDSAQRISTIAGTAPPGFHNGPARSETGFKSPCALAAHPDGGLLIADAGAHNIRFISPPSRH